MRIQRATLLDSYKVHKTLIEYLGDVGQEKQAPDYIGWVERLSDDSQHYLLLLHGRKVIGMVWGREIRPESKKTLLVEGRFLRRAYRGKHKFVREVFKAQQSLSKDFDVVRLLLPKNGVKLKKYKVLGTLVEVSK